MPDLVKVKDVNPEQIQAVNGRFSKTIFLKISLPILLILESFFQ